MRLKLDVRRIWECPACGRRVKREGEITSYQCPCQEPAGWMRLVEDRRIVREYQPYIVPEIAADELMGDAEPAASEPAIREECVVIDVLEPVEVESLPDDGDKSQTPEEEAEPAPPLIDAAPSQPEPTANGERPMPESPATEPGPGSSTGSPPENEPKEPSRSGKSRRRRSGRKRNRRGSKEGG